MESAAVSTRNSARVLVVDDDDRVLLFRCRVDAEREDRGHMWITPGGGVRDGETLEEAAARELREETGLALRPADLGPVVARSSGEWGWRDKRYLAVDTFFFLRVPSFAVDTAGMESYERRMLTVHRWWARSEIEAATELVLPIDLVPLLSRLLAGERPDPPVELPWRAASELFP